MFGDGRLLASFQLTQARNDPVCAPVEHNANVLRAAFPPGSLDQGLFCCPTAGTAKISLHWPT